MYLWELQSDSTIIIKSSTKIDTVEFETNILSINGKTVFVQPVVDSDKVISFASDFVKSDILYDDKNGRSHIFKNVDIINDFDAEGNIISSIFCEKESEVLNRREAKRFSINEVGVFAPGPHRAAVPALLRDISATGVCIVSSINAHVDDIGRFSFIPEKVKGFGNISAEIKIKRVMVDADSKRVLCGCEFVKEEPVVNKYIASIQRQQLANRCQ